MNRRTDLLGAISGREYIKAGSPFGYLNRLGEKALSDILGRMLAYYKVNDYETSNDLADIFATLYIDEADLSYDRVAEKYHIHVYTLDRYRQRYNRLAAKFVAEEMKRAASNLD